jgi:hypothetical protein
MMDSENEQSWRAEEPQVEAPDSKASPETIRVMLLATSALGLLAAMSVYHSFSRPGYGLTGLLKAVLFVLLAVKLWLTKPLGSSFPEGGFRRKLVSCFPLIVLVAFGLDQVGEARQRTAEKQLALRKAAWKQSLERQREAVSVASSQASDATKTYNEAFQAWAKTHEPAKMANGEPGFRHDPEAYRKMEGAMKEMLRATDRHFSELQRLGSLGLEEPGRFGRP